MDNIYKLCWRKKRGQKADVRVFVQKEHKHCMIISLQYTSSTQKFILFDKML